jgi:hypothetical protein
VPGGRVAWMEVPAGKTSVHASTHQELCPAPIPCSAVLHLPPEHRSIRMPFADQIHQSVPGTSPRARLLCHALTSRCAICKDECPCSAIPASAAVARSYTVQGNTSSHLFQHVPIAHGHCCSRSRCYMSRSMLDTALHRTKSCSPHAFLCQLYLGVAVLQSACTHVYLVYYRHDPQSAYTAQNRLHALLHCLSSEPVVSTCQRLSGRVDQGHQYRCCLPASSQQWTAQLAPGHRQAAPARVHDCGSQP